MLNPEDKYKARGFRSPSPRRCYPLAATPPRRGAIAARARSGVPRGGSPVPAPDAARSVPHKSLSYCQNYSPENHRLNSERETHRNICFPGGFRVSPLFVSAARETPQEISPARGRVYRLRFQLSAPHAASLSARLRCVCIRTCGGTSALIDHCL